MREWCPDRTTEHDPFDVRGLRPVSNHETQQNFEDKAAVSKAANPVPTAAPNIIPFKVQFIPRHFRVKKTTARSFAVSSIVRPKRGRAYPARRIV